MPRLKCLSKDPTSIRLRRAKKEAERKASMTEADITLERENNRISKKLYRAIMDPAAREKFLEKQREEQKAKRKKLRIKLLQEELKIIEWQVDTLQGQGTATAVNVGEKLELETRRGQLQQQIREVRQNTKSKQIRNRIYKLPESQKKADRRAKMTEAEKILERETNRISRKLRRAASRTIMEPEAREKFLLKQREEKKANRRELRINGLQEELKIIESQVDTLQGQGAAANVGEKLELETRRSQLQQQIQEVTDNTKSEQNLNRMPVPESQKKAERRAKMTEAEKIIKREKNRISAKLRQDLMTPEERENVMEKTRIRRKINRLQRALKVVEGQLDTLEGHGKEANVDEKLKLETRRGQLELQIKEIREAQPREHIQRTEPAADNSVNSVDADISSEGSF